MSLPDKSKLKNWFNGDAAIALAEQISGVYSDFDSERFVRLIARGIGTLEFKERVNKFARVLRETLPPDYLDALSILIDSLPEALANCDSPMDGRLQWPVGEFIALYGLEHFDDSFEAMEILTQVFTAEFAVRPFVLKFPGRSVERFLSLTNHESPHVRRWCSEGLRVRLPWGIVLHDLAREPSSILPVLEALKDDPELYVRRSVANNLNDLSKLHPDLVVDVCRSWLRDRSEERVWLAGHALRTLIKEGHPKALELFGFKSVKDRVTVDLQVAPRSVLLGESVRLTGFFHNCSQRTAALCVELVFHLVRSGNKTAPKIFRWKSFALAAGEKIELEKTQKMESNTARELYCGLHRVEVQVNGDILATGQFQLV